jgi:hypothetical protein
MNEESRPARRLPDNNILAATIQDAGDGSSERAFIEAVRGKASDTPDSRTNGYKPASEAENVVQDATRTVPGQARWRTSRGSSSGSLTISACPASRARNG